MPVTFESEQKLIRSCLHLDKQALESALVELNQLGGKCHMCIQPTSSSSSQGGYLTDLIGHMRDSHAITIRAAYFRRICLCCGAQHTDLPQLVRHLYDKHKVLMFSTLNKIFYVTSRTNEKAAAASTKAASVLVPLGQTSQQQNFISKHLGLAHNSPSQTARCSISLSVSKLHDPNLSKKGIFLSKKKWGIFFFLIFL